MEAISFRALSKKDMPLFNKWADLPHVKGTWFLDGYEPSDNFSENIEGNGYDYAYVVYLDDVPIGYIQGSDLYAYRTKCPTPKGLFTHEEPGTFCLDLFIGEASFLNKGYGAKIVKAFVEKLLSEFRAERILVDPACSNTRAIRCYEKAGFKIIRKEHDGTTMCYVMEYGG